MSRQAAEWFRVSEQWRREAEAYRLTGMPLMAKYCARQHIIWRKSARTLAKQAKAVKP